MNCQWDISHTPNEVAIVAFGGRRPAAYTFARSKQKLLDEGQNSLAKAARHMKKNADKNRRSLEFNIRDKVILKLTP